MKIPVGKALVVAALICTTPLFSGAQNIASRPGLVNRSIERLTLLPGPDILSPARTTPTMAPAPLKLGGNSIFLFGPPGESALSSPIPKRPDPELLRFDSTIKPLPVQPRWQFQRGPKPDDSKKI